MTLMIEGKMNTLCIASGKDKNPNGELCNGSSYNSSKRDRSEMESASESQ